jgi:hypothetical protein
MALLRAKCISTKVTDEEYQRLAARAGDRSLSEWARTVLLEAESPPIDAVVLAEVLALRTILLNLHFALCAGQSVTTDWMQQLIDRADQNKVRQLHERLTAIARRTP